MTLHKVDGIVTRHVDRVYICSKATFGRIARQIGQFVQITHLRYTEHTTTGSLQRAISRSASAADKFDRLLAFARVYGCKSRERPTTEQVHHAQFAVAITIMMRRFPVLRSRNLIIRQYFRLPACTRLICADIPIFITARPPKFSNFSNLFVRFAMIPWIR